MNNRKLSGMLALVLRHPSNFIQFGKDMDKEGWVCIKLLLNRLRAQGHEVTLNQIQEVVTQDDKQRYAIKNGFIRANQGHSLKVKIQYAQEEPPEVLFHGTATRFLTAILSEGLKPMKRHAVHLTENEEVAINTGSRYGKPVVLCIQAKAMHQQGFRFKVSENKVWLVDTVPPQFISQKG